MHKTIPVFDICCSVFQLTKLKQIQLTSDPADAASVRFLGADILKRRVALARCSLAVPKLAGSRCEPCAILGMALISFNQFRGCYYQPGVALG